MTYTYVLKNGSHQAQEFPRLRKHLRPGETVTVGEALFKSAAVQRSLAQGRFTMVKRDEVNVAPPVAEDSKPDGDEPKQPKKSKGRRGRSGKPAAKLIEE